MRVIQYPLIYSLGTKKTTTVKYGEQSEAVCFKNLQNYLLYIP